MGRQGRPGRFARGRYTTRHDERQSRSSWPVNARFARAILSCTRLAHWPIWIWVCLHHPRAADLRPVRSADSTSAWPPGLGVVMLLTGVAGLRGRLPAWSRGRTSSASPRTSRTRSTGASATHRWPGAPSISFALLNSRRPDRGDCHRAAGICGSSTSLAYFPHSRSPSGFIGARRDAAAGQALDARRGARVGATSTDRCGAVCLAQPLLWLLWGVLPETPAADTLKLAAFPRRPGRRVAGRPTAA